MIAVSSTDTGGDSNDDEESSGAIGSASVTDSFSSNDNESESGSGHSQVLQVSTTDDGHGNTVSINESDYTSLSETGSFGNQDTGEEDFAEANGLPTADSEVDTDTVSGELDPTETETTMAHDTTVSVDPATGMTTSTDYTENGKMNSYAESV